MTDWQTEVEEAKRFNFGANWKTFLSDVDARRIEGAEAGLRFELGNLDLTGRSFLDVGSGSGLSSLAARNLGAVVRSFDYDPDSVEATRLLRQRTRPDDEQWTIEGGSVLDTGYLAALGTFDVVYSFGVLHHTGDMWQAIANVLPLVKPGGLLAIAIYNDQGRRSRAALAMKRRYARAGHIGRAVELARFAIPSTIKAAGIDLLRRRNPLRSYGERERGMSRWPDIVDWVGGYPFEVAKPEEILDVVRPGGFELVRMTTCGGGPGNNLFTFRRALGPTVRRHPRRAT